MWRHASWIGSLVIVLSGCAALSASAPQDPRNRPLEERCVRAQPSRSASRPGMTQAEVQAEARAAAQRGELDKACDWL